MSSMRRILSAIVFFFLLSSLPLLAARKTDTSSSRNGQFGNCPPDPTKGPCPVLNAQGTVPLSGTDAGGNAVKVTINLYDWGFFPCDPVAQTCQSSPTINSAVLDVVLTGTDSVGIQSFVVKGTLSAPSYVYCGGSVGGFACLTGPAPDGSNIQEPTPIAGADSGSSVNTRWDFGGIPASTPPPPAVPFDQLSCSSDGNDSICTSTDLGEAILTISNSVADNNLSADSNNYLVTLTDGTQLGNVNLVPASPTRQVATTNNTQATATLITSTSFQDFTDTSQAFPQINADGSEEYPAGFVPLPLSNPPPCNPSNGVTGQTVTDNRTFRTAWYTYTAAASGSITLNTAGSRYDTLIYVFTGSPLQPTVIACNDDAPGGLLQAVATFNATQGTVYEILIGQTPTIQTIDPNNANLTDGYPLTVDGTLYFNFQFTATPPTASLSTASLQFGSQPVNSASAAQPVTLTNNGPNQLTFSSITASSGFSQTNTCGASIAPAASCTINLTFTPTTVGSNSGSLVITDNASNSPQSVTLAGTGTSAVIPGFQLTADPLTPSPVTAGQSASTVITVAASGGFASAVSLTCAITPTVSVPPTCAFAPSSLPNGSGTSTLTVSTVAAVAQLAPINQNRMRVFYAALLPIGGFVWLASAFPFARGKSRWHSSCIIALLLFVLALATSCGGGGSSSTTTTTGNGGGGTPGTTAGSYTVTVTASGGTASPEQMPLTLTVQ